MKHLKECNQINYDNGFIELGFKETGYESGRWELKLNKNESIVCHFIQREWSVNNWLTIEFVQKRNRFTKYNGLIYKEDEILFLITLILKFYKR